MLDGQLACSREKAKGLFFEVARILDGEQAAEKFVAKELFSLGEIICKQLFQCRLVHRGAFMSCALPSYTANMRKRPKLLEDCVAKAAAALIYGKADGGQRFSAGP